MKATFAKVAISILVVSLLFTGAQGIRFKKRLFSSVGHHHHEIIRKERFTLFIKASDDGRSSVKEIVHCKDCTTGSINRKLISTTTTTATSFSTTTSKNEVKPTSSLGKQSGNFTTNSPPTSDDDHVQNKSSDDDDHYVGLTDVAEMDYSPARRKPPIHN
ncbi:hypothetical protein AB3S75_021072 [Citrus x aurantiifolia]